MLRAVRPGGRLSQGQVNRAAQIHHLAALLAVRLSAVVPTEFTCIADETRVILARDHVGVRTLDLAAALEDNAESWEAGLRDAIWQTLSDFQDAIVEELHQGWPMAPGTGIAEPRVRVLEGTAVGASYSVGGDVIIDLGEFPLARSAAE